MASIDEEIKTRFTDERHRFVANLVFTAGWMQNMFTEQLKPYGLSMQQFNILRILRGAGDWKTMTDVKSLMVEKSPNATRLVDKLLDKELLERQRDQGDRRVVYIRINKKGLKLLKQIDDDEHVGQKEFFDRIDKKDAILMSDILDKMRG